MVIWPELDVVDEQANECDPLPPVLFGPLLPFGLVAFTFMVEEGLEVAV